MFSKTITGRNGKAVGGGEVDVRPMKHGEAARFNELTRKRHYFGKAKSVGDYPMQVAERNGVAFKTQEGHCRCGTGRGIRAGSHAFARGTGG